jgi:uncharacterized protein (TIGR02444 family)
MQNTSPFWDFSLGFYAQPGIAEICLDLQDRFGADVNVVLYLLWQAQRQRRLTLTEIEKLIALISNWQLHVVRPLRGVRRFLRDPGPTWSSEGVASFRQRVKGEELLAERLQQAVMENAFPDPGQTDEISAAAKANLENYSLIIEAEFPARHLSTILDCLSRE